MSNLISVRKTILLAVTLVMAASPATVFARAYPHGKPAKSTGGTTTTTTTTTGGTTTTTSTTGTSTTGYLTTLNPTYTPSPITWNGRQWRTNAGSSYVTNMGRSVKISPLGKKIRFELQNTSDDNSVVDGDTIRRSELSGSVYGDPTRLPNGTSLWGGFSTIHHAWADPVGMSALWGGVYGQIHIGSSFGGSPALAFRRKANGTFRITTRGEYNTSGTVRYEAPLSWNQPHDIVYNIVLDPTAGSIRVWIDGVKVVDAANVSIGSHHAEAYFNLGAYFSGGITSPVVAEYANVVYPNTPSLATRVSTRPSWPID